MKYRAVIFDLFGTLVDKFPVNESIDILREMAAVLSLPAEGFVRLWFETFYERHSGCFEDLEADIEYVCQKLGARPESIQTRTAAQINLDYVAENMIPRPGAVELLAGLKGEGYKTGLISNWSDEVPTVWHDGPLAGFFDVTLFSCKAGMMKPDPRIYLMAAEQLSVKPGKCLYIGDGDSGEMNGAAEAGMNAVLFRATGDRNDKNAVNGQAEGWAGPTVSLLSDVMKLLK